MMNKTLPLSTTRASLRGALATRQSSPILDLFRNSLCQPTTVMLNLFQHLKEITKQVRDDTGEVAMLSFERGLLYLDCIAPLAMTKRVNQKSRAAHD